MSDLAFIQETIRRAQLYRDIEHLHMRVRDDCLQIVGTSRTKAASVMASSVHETSLNAQGCLGSLPYLRSILDSEFAPHLDLQVDTKPTQSGSERISELIFHNKKVTMVYRATDASVHNVVGPKPLKSDDWEITFVWPTAEVENFRDVWKVTQNVSRAQAISARDDIFQMQVRENTVIAKFGNSNNGAELTITEEAEILDGRAWFDAFFMSEHVMSTLNQKGSIPRVSMNKNAMLVEQATELGMFRTILTSRRVDDEY